MKHLATVLTLGTIFLGNPAVVAGDGLPVVPCESAATYHPLGYLWAPLPPVTSNPEQLHFHKAAPVSSGAPALTQANAQGAVMAAFATWETVKCDSVAPNFLHVVAADALYQELNGGDTLDNGLLTSHKNVVHWDAQGDHPLLGSGTLAYTRVQYFEAHAHAIDGDMMFNDFDFRWRVSLGDGTRGCSSGDVNCFDVQTVALHEVGHFVGLGHVSCAGAVMYPEGEGAASRHVLASHEEAGLCALYPPRVGQGERVTGESCENSAQCAGVNSPCLEQSMGGKRYGHCVQRCAADQDCGAGFFCGKVPLADNAELKFCKPGIRGTATNSEGEGDLCTRCSSGSHCRSGLCMQDEESSFCSQACSLDSPCPDDFSCVRLPSGESFCWPDDPEACGIDARSGLNDVCYQEGGAANGTDFFDPCGPGLKCVGFRSRCEGVTGSCVLYCDTGTPCRDNLTCCYGIDGDGHCMAPTLETTVGGCFALRAEGEACVTAEQSVCVEGSECLHFESPAQAKCYETCAGRSCVGNERCGQFTVQCDEIEVSEINLCCDNADRERCLPGHISARGDTGVACYVNADCYSDQCVTYYGQAACTRSCDLMTGLGCPAATADVNGDGVPDGEFKCLSIGDAPRCWPTKGPIPPLVNPIPPTTGCCRAVGHPLAFGDLLMSALVWLPFAFMWRRSRRRRVRGPDWWSRIVRRRFGCGS